MLGIGAGGEWVTGVDARPRLHEGQMGDEHHDLSGADHVTTTPFLSTLPTSRPWPKHPPHRSTLRGGDGLPERHEECRKSPVSRHQEKGQEHQLNRSLTRGDAGLQALLTDQKEGRLA